MDRIEPTSGNHAMAYFVKLKFAVKTTIDGHIVSITAETAKKAFAEAIGW
jgi:hypothetical protein